MTPALHDVKRAALGGSVLLGAAAVMIFEFKPGSFTASIQWVIIFAPGFIPAVVVSDWLAGHVPGAFWTLFWTFNYVWYFLISLLALKLFRGIKAWRNRAPASAQ